MMNVYYFHHQADELLGTASEQFLGKTVKEIKQTILQTLEGHLRAILGMLKFSNWFYFNFLLRYERTYFIKMWRDRVGVLIHSYIDIYTYERDFYSYTCNTFNISNTKYERGTARMNKLNHMWCWWWRSVFVVFHHAIYFVLLFTFIHMIIFIISIALLLRHQTHASR